MEHTVVSSALALQSKSASIRLRARLPQIKVSALNLRNRAFAAPAYHLDGGRVFLWQDSALVRPVGELHCKLGTDALYLTADNLSSLEPRLLGFESFVASEACTSLVEHALSPVLDLIERLAGHPVNCEAFRRITAQPSAETADDGSIQVGFILTGTANQPEVRGWLRAAASVWRTLDFSRGPAVPSVRHQAVPLAFSVRLGRCQLPLTELQQLSVGDALRITPRVPRNEGLPVQLVHAWGGNFGCRARVAGDQLILETLMSITMSTTPPPTAPASPSASAARGPMAVPSSSTPLAADNLLSALECDLSFELGSLRMSLAEVGKLKIGQALRTGVNLKEQPVHILSSGREIARGELAAIGDELVVVVTDTHGLPQV